MNRKGFLLRLCGIVGLGSFVASKAVSRPKTITSDIVRKFCKEFEPNRVNVYSGFTGSQKYKDAQREMNHLTSDIAFADARYGLKWDNGTPNLSRPKYKINRISR